MDTIDYVSGVEDPNWEQDPASGHNKYQDLMARWIGHDTCGHSQYSSFCGGCHGKFHKKNVGIPKDGIAAQAPGQASDRYFTL
jgi:hypothetical protein